MVTDKKRILSIDILRGLVMIIMALDHTRDFFHATSIANPMNPEKTNTALYFTRLITHFCAPTFVFLSGISAYLSSQNKDPKQVSLFLIKRGFWLLIVEVLIITLALTFNPFYNLIVLQVIWSIGWSMILLGILSKISYRLVAVVGIVLFFGHNILNYITIDSKSFIGGLIEFTLTTRAEFIPLGSEHTLGVFYTILPWTGVMFLGFAVGKWYSSTFDEIKRKHYLFYSGLGLFVSFIVLRFFSLYGNPEPRVDYGDSLKNFFDFLNVSKYPPSLQYLGMTLGPALMILSVLENVKNKFSKILMVYGNVPFFYYVLHFYLIHFLVVIFFFATGYGVKDIVTPNSPFLFRPDSFGFALPFVYIIWLSIVAILYKPCAWFKQYKATHTQWWLKYL